MRCYSHLSDDEREQIGLAKAVGEAEGGDTCGYLLIASQVSRATSRDLPVAVIILDTRQDAGGIGSRPSDSPLAAPHLPGLNHPRRSSPPRLVLPQPSLRIDDLKPARLRCRSVPQRIDVLIFFLHREVACHLTRNGNWCNHCGSAIFPSQRNSGMDRESGPSRKIPLGARETAHHLRVLIARSISTNNLPQSGDRQAHELGEWRIRQSLGANYMNTAGAHELGYASIAIVAALLDTLIHNRVISRAEASSVLDDADDALKGLGNRSNVLSAIRIVRCARAISEAYHGLDRGFPSAIILHPFAALRSYATAPAAWRCWRRCAGPRRG
jgi:hypothetical protein